MALTPQPEAKTLHPVDPVGPQVEAQRRARELLASLIHQGGRQERHRRHGREPGPLFLSAELVAAPVVPEEGEAVRDPALLDEGEAERALDLATARETLGVDGPR